MPTFRQDEKLGTKVPLIKTADFNDKSVTTEKLAEGSVTNSKLAPESVTQDKFDKELLQIFEAAAGLPKNLIETIQNIDSTLVNHQRQISSNDDDISDLQTKTKQIKDTVDGIAVSGGASVGSAVTYDNTQSGLDALNIQNAIDELVNNLGHYETNEEWLRAYTDTENKFLWGIRIDGSIDWAVGIPRPIQKKIEELIATDTAIQESITQLRTELIESLNEKIRSLKDNEIKNLQDTKVDKEEGKSLIEDEVKKCFRVIENEEFIKAIVDSDDKVLFGFYRATGKPYYPLNEMYHVIQNEEYFAVWVTTDDKVVLGIRRDGQIIGEIHAVNALKLVVSQLLSDVASLQEKVGTIDTNLKELLNVFSLQENPEYMAVETDAEGKVLSATNLDGSHYIHNAKSETIPEEFSHIEDLEGRMEITTDAEGKLLGYRDSEGTRHEKALDAKKYIQEGVEYKLKDFAEKRVLDNKIQELDLKDLNGVKDHSRRNLLDPSKCTSSYNDGENTYSPPNAGYILSNPIECNAGDIFTRTGTATGMVVVSDKDDKNARRLMPNGQLPGSTLKIPSDWTWASFIRFAVQESALSDLIISKGTYTISEEESGNFCTIDNLKIQAFNLSNDVAYIKATDGKYFELYIDAADNYSIKARQVDITVIQPNNLPSDWVSFTYSGTFNGLFDRFVLCNNKYLFELKETGITKLASIGNNIYMYHNAEHFYNNKGESRYATILRGSKKDDTVGVGFCLFNDKMELIEKDLGFMGNTIDSKLNWIPDSHDFIYIDDGHYLFFFLVSKEVNVPNFGTKTFTSILINEVKKINGIYKVIGSFDASDYPKLFTDIYLEKSANLHMNTLALDYDNNLIVNFRDANSFIKIRRVEKEDGTIIIGSETKDYNEAIIGRVGGYRNIGYLDSKRVLPNGFSFSDVPTGLEVSSDPIEDWQWYHCHDVKYWGMKEINGKNYPTYTLFDNNYWTSESYGDSAIQNPRNNYMNNPKCNGWSYESANGNDEDYKAKTVSRIIQISIDWDNSKIVDYKVYEIPEYFSQEMCGATMLNEGILALAFSYMGVWGVYDFISELGTTTIQTDKIYKGAEILFEAKYDSLRYCYRSNVYKLK